MEHRNLDHDLEKILPKQPPILEHVLHSIYALCLDIQTHSGSRINKGIVNDYRQFNNSLTLVANLLCTIYDAHSAELQEKVQVAFPEGKVRDIEQQTRDTERIILDHKDDLDKLKAAENELQKQLAIEKKLLEDLTSKKDTIEQLQSTLNTTISQIKQIDLPALEQQKTALEAEKTQLETRKSTLTGNINDLTQELEKSRQACCGSDTRCGELTTELETCRRKLEASEARSKELEGQLSDANSRSSKLTEDNTNAENQLIALMANNKTAQEKLDNTNANINTQQGIYDNLCPQLASSTKALNELLGKIQTARQTIASNNQAITAGSAQLAELEADVKTGEAELTTLNTAITAAQSALALAQAQIKKLEGDKSAAEQSLSEAQAQERLLSGQVSTALAKEQDLNKLIEAHKQTMARLANVDTEIQTANADLATARTDLSTAESKRDGLLKNISDANAAAKAFDAESARLTTEFQAADQVRQDKEKVRDGLAVQLKDAQDKSAQLDQQSIDLTADLERTNDEITEKTNAVGALNADIAKVKTERTSLRSKVSALTQMLNDQKKINEDYRSNELQTAQTDLDKADAEMTVLTQTRNSLLTQIGQLKEKYKKVNDEIGSFEVALALNKTELEEASQQLDTARHNAEDAEALLEQTKLQIQGLTGRARELQKEADELKSIYESYDPVAVEAKFENTKNSYERKLADIQKMGRDLDQLKIDYENARNTYDTLLQQKQKEEQKQSSLNQENAALTEELSKLQSADVQARFTQLDKENETLRTIRSMILADAAVLKLSTGNVDEALAEELDYIDSTLEHLRSCIRREVSTLHNSIK